MWRLIPEFDTSLIWIPQTGHIDWHSLLACLNSFVSEVCWVVFSCNFRFLLPAGWPLSDGDWALGIPVGVALKLSNNFIWTALGLSNSLVLSGSLCDLSLPSFCFAVPAEFESTFGSLGSTWKNVFSETGGVSAFLLNFSLTGTCTSKTKSLAAVGTATETLACSSCQDKNSLKENVYEKNLCLMALHMGVNGTKATFLQCVSMYVQKWFDCTLCLIDIFSGYKLQVPGLLTTLYLLFVLHGTKGSGHLRDKW